MMTDRKWSGAAAHADMNERENCWPLNAGAGESRGGHTRELALLSSVRERSPSSHGRIITCRLVLLVDGAGSACPPGHTATMRPRLERLGAPSPQGGQMEPEVRDWTTLA